MTGRVTMLGISRWAGIGGSYRTIQRFFGKTISWCTLSWVVIRCHILDKDDVVLIAGNETTVTKSGKKTHGISRFFSTIFDKSVRGVAFLCLSIVSVKRHRSYPLIMEQVIRDEAKEKNVKASGKENKAGKGKRGRKPGSKNKNSRDIELTPHLLWVQGWIKKLLSIIKDIPVIYFLYDGVMGNNRALQMVRRCGLHLISKLRRDSVLWLPDAGHYQGRGPHKKYGKKLNYTDIPREYLKQSSTEKNIRSDTYQMSLWHKLFADLLNVVVIVKTNLKTGATAHIVLFSSDLNLTWDKLILYYHLRFQIEFNFRDAKQHWGLEDFMNINATPVHNAANLAMFMVNVSGVLLMQYRDIASVNDLKSSFRGYKYAQEIFNLLNENANPVLFDQIYAKLSAIGNINGLSNAA